MGNVPLVFTRFRTQVEKIGLNVRTSFEEPDELSTIDVHENEWGSIPTLTELGYKLVQTDDRAVAQFRGGETEGQKRVKDYIWNENNVLSSYKQTRNELLGLDTSTKFSPWLALGCVSPRMVYEQVLKYEENVGKNESTYWIVFELLWRDYFRFI